MLCTSTGYNTFININGPFAIELVLIKIETNNEFNVKNN